MLCYFTTAYALAFYESNYGALLPHLIFYAFNEDKRAIILVKMIFFFKNVCMKLSLR